MPISRKRGNASLNVLLERGLVTPDQEKAYRGMVERGLSYRDLMIEELGEMTGELYLREEEAQHWVLHGMKMDLSLLSVPEVLLVEDDPGAEPWHQERYSEKNARMKFRSEAGEPWHQSLWHRYPPLPSVRNWFRGKREWKRLTQDILRLAYRV